jgi:hypothetical protein
MAVCTILTFVLCALGMFMGYPSPAPKNEATGSPWVRYTCTDPNSNAERKYIATLWEGCVETFDSGGASTRLDCKDYADYGDGHFPADLKVTMVQLSVAAVSTLTIAAGLVFLLVLMRTCSDTDDGGTYVGGGMGSCSPGTGTGTGV